MCLLGILLVLCEFCRVTADLVRPRAKIKSIPAPLCGSGNALIHYNGIVFAAECLAERMQWKSGG